MRRLPSSRPVGPRRVGACGGFGPGRVVGGAGRWGVVGVARACGRETWRAGVAPEPRGDAPVPPAGCAPAVWLAIGPAARYGRRGRQRRTRQHALLRRRTALKGREWRRRPAFATWPIGVGVRPNRRLALNLSRRQPAFRRCYSRLPARTTLSGSQRRP